MSRLDNKPQIWKLAVDLGLGASSHPVAEILNLVIGRVRGVAKTFACLSLNDLLVATAGDVGTVFEEIRKDDDLDRIQGLHGRVDGVAEAGPAAVSMGRGPVLGGGL